MVSCWMKKKLDILSKYRFGIEKLIAKKNLPKAVRKNLFLSTSRCNFKGDLSRNYSDKFHLNILHCIITC